MKLKLDENLGHRLAEVFRAAEHDAVTVKGEGLAGHPTGKLWMIQPGRLREYRTESEEDE